MALRVNKLDHLVLTVGDIDVASAWYERVLGMTPITFAGGRRALVFGDSKINLHQAGHEFEPKARQALPGTADLCFITDTPIETVSADLAAQGVSLVEGIVVRTGAISALRSVYVRDPDGNLIEISNRVIE